MCYDISFTVKMRELADLFPDLIFDDQLEFDFGGIDHIQGPGVWPHHPIIYRSKDDGKLHCRFMQWSIVRHTDTEMPTDLKLPSYQEKRNSMLNIRSERILDDPTSYWFQIKSYRCLFPVTNIFEHREVLGWKKSVPYCIKPKDQTIFFIPGLYAKVQYIDKATGEVLDPVWTASPITTKANTVMGNIHNSGENRHRMPLFTPFDKALEFLEHNITYKKYREILNLSILPQDLIYYPVHPIRNIVERPDGLAKTAPWDWGILPELGLRNPKSKDEENSSQGSLAF